jgi:5,10-methylenetetrahydromethanopterin reductase
MPAIGVMIPRDVPPAEVRPFAQMVERLGYDEVWVVEDCFWTSGIANAALALGATERVHVGIGIMPAVLRNPALAAMELATLAGAYGGRMTAGFGHGVADWMRQVGAYPPSPLAALEATMRDVKRLLEGETVDSEKLSDVKLVFPPSQPPAVLAGSTGPKGLALAGRVGDGAILSEGSSPEFVSQAREQVRGAREAQGEPTIVAYAHLSVDADAATAREQLKPDIAAWLKRHRGRPQFEALSFAGAVPEPVDNLQDGWVDEMTVSGTPDDCRAAIGRLHQAGADTVVLVPRLDEAEDQLEQLSGA